MDKLLVLIDTNFIFNPAVMVISYEQIIQREVFMVHARSVTHGWYIIIKPVVYDNDHNQHLFVHIISIIIYCFIWSIVKC